jgi:LacI family transcriptional regulator, galactose operon repressor
MVSYVVNGRAGDQVQIAAETRLRILKAIEELGYEPDARAQALRSGDSKTIGLILPDIRNPHFWENADGVEQEARAAGYHLLLSSMDLNADYGREIFKSLSGRRIDGLIFLMGSFIDQSDDAKNTLVRLRKRQLPIVEIGDKFNQNHNVDCVVSDYQKVTSEMMDHLFSLGHRRIGIINGVALPALASDRVRSYQDSLRSEGIALDKSLIINCGPTIEDGYQATIRLLTRPDRPTAIIAINDILAMGVLRAASDLGFQIPKDLSVVGYDDIFAANYLTPRLTTATKDAVGLGREAVRLLLERIKAPDQPSRRIEIQARFIIRESTGTAPVLQSKTVEAVSDSGSR